MWGDSGSSAEFGRAPGDPIKVCHAVSKDCNTFFTHPDTPQTPINTGPEEYREKKMKKVCAEIPGKCQKMPSKTTGTSFSVLREKLKRQLSLVLGQPLLIEPQHTCEGFSLALRKIL